LAASSSGVRVVVAKEAAGTSEKAALLITSGYNRREKKV